MTVKNINIRQYLLFISILIGLVAVPLQAADFHAPPRDFIFGNHIDTHQETKLKTSGNAPVSLSGFFYIIYTGDIDSASGLPVARHPRGIGQDEECGVDVDCVAGWLIDGVPANAKFLYHAGVNGDDHPVWMINRINIIQPGSFTHFHWIGTDSSDPRADTVPEVCDVDNAANLEPEAVDTVCPGWFLEIRAVKNFAFEHGGEIVPVQAGIDNATHLNLVTNYADVPGINRTR